MHIYIDVNTSIDIGKGKGDKSEYASLMIYTVKMTNLTFEEHKSKHASLS